MPFPYVDETKELDEFTRRDAGGSFIALQDGVTHYELGGNETGLPVVMVHGFSVPYFIFDTTFNFLTESGFKALRFDLFGRGFSDRPRLNYDIDLFVRQLKDLLDALKIKNVNLIGLSMGGPITASFAKQYPGMVEKLVLIDPAGAKPIVLSRLLEMTKLPGLGELVLGLFGTGNMVRNIASDLFDPQLILEFQSRYMVQMRYKGFKHAILSTMRNGMLGSFYDTYACVGNLKKPTLLFWGTNDTTVPFKDSELILKAIPHAQFHPIQDCGHIPHFEKPEIVNPILSDFLKTAQSPATNRA